MDFTVSDGKQAKSEFLSPIPRCLSGHQAVLSTYRVRLLTSNNWTSLPRTPKVWTLVDSRSRQVDNQDLLWHQVNDSPWFFPFTLQVLLMLSVRSWPTFVHETAFLMACWWCEMTTWELNSVTNVFCLANEKFLEKSEPTLKSMGDCHTDILIFGLSKKFQKA